MRKVNARFSGIGQHVIAALNDRWQTGRMIGAQIAFPPDMIARRRARYRELYGNDISESACKAHGVASTLGKLLSSGVIEKRRVNGSLNEYRLVQKKHD